MTTTHPHFTVVLGSFFALARAVLLRDLKPKCLPNSVWTCLRTVLAVVFMLVGYGSLIPALFWSALYKALNTVEEIID